MFDRIGGRNGGSRQDIPYFIVPIFLMLYLLSIIF